MVLLAGLLVQVGCEQAFLMDRVQSVFCDQVGLIGCVPKFVTATGWALHTGRLLATGCAVLLVKVAGQVL